MCMCVWRLEVQGREGQVCKVMLQSGVISLGTLHSSLREHRGR